jgi:hypothetical protein
MQVLLMAVMATVSLVVSTSSNVATHRNLEWSDHYANAKVQAAAQQRPLLVVLENSGDPAGRFNPDQLAADEAQAELLGHFQLCRMDVTTDYGKRVAAAFGASKFPFTAITDKSARYITFQAAGAMSPEQWKETLNSRKDGYLVTTQPAVQRVEASKIITSWPSADVYSMPSNCPNCVKNQYYR